MNNGRIGIVLLVLFGFITLIGSCQQGNKVSIKTAQYAVNGQKLYIQHCENCHGSKGEGLGKLYPPLTDSLFFSEYRSALPCIIKNGMNSPIVIHGETYHEPMPPNPTLSDVEIAYLLTYITTSFGNKTDIYDEPEVHEALKDCK